VFVKQHPGSPPLPNESELWTDAEVSLFFRSGGLLKPLMTPWAQGKKAGSSPMPAVKKEALQVPEAVSTFVNEPLCRRDDSYASPEEYVEHVSLTGQHERSAAVSLIPLGDAWMAQLRSAPHLKPFETHSIGLAGEIQAVSHCSWTCSADPALARGVDCRLFLDSLSKRVVGAVHFGKAASVNAAAMPMRDLVAAAAFQMVLTDVAEEAVKLQKATVVSVKEFSMTVVSPPKIGCTYRIQAEVTASDGAVINTTAKLCAENGQEVAIAAVDFRSHT